MATSRRRTPLSAARLSSNRLSNDIRLAVAAAGEWIVAGADPEIAAAASRPPTTGRSRVISERGAKHDLGGARRLSIGRLSVERIEGLVRHELEPEVRGVIRDVEDVHAGIDR